ncbi:hypothetical protein H4582DRAFT_2071320 [Lactarius indigo]|nr:hypothetical protein H4582DRAFT_2071320 [Lactarius indigo]
MSPAKSSQVVVDEETPHIHDSYAQRKPTPLPNTQLFLLHLARLEELIMSHSINPTSTSDLSIVGCDKRKWSRVSNHTGHKSIFLLGPEGSVVPTILFGLSRPSWALSSSAPGLCSPRCLAGVSNGNLGVIACLRSLRTDQRRAEVFVVADGSHGRLYDMVASCRDRKITGQIASLILSGPNIHISCRAWWLLAVPSYHRDSDVFGSERNLSAKVKSTKADLNLTSQKKCVTQAPKQDPEGPLPLRALLTRPVLISVSSYAMLDMAAMTLIPLVWVTPVELGGIDFDLNPTSIGMWMSGYGRLNGPVQFRSFPRLVARLGPGHVFLTSVLNTFFVDIQVRSRNDRVARSE